ncbi:G2/mitotic-specific cyclin [Polyrhizophydium stewartii]|uniref:G2/mitotic-specific cyclin n=1 Tax=Polyrhizophydium stewartii TaxID=2732419 RepID=A0ABR4NHZ4_9FUNG|nr:G2/mitotic-specific cyclin [Polyrhizophydium stewartii]
MATRSSVKDVAVAGKPDAVAAVATKKRAALGDVSNVHPTAGVNPGGKVKTGKAVASVQQTVVAAKPRATRSTAKAATSTTAVAAVAARPATRKAEATGHRARATAASAAAGAAPSLAKKTQKALKEAAAGSAESSVASAISEVDEAAAAPEQPESDEAAASTKAAAVPRASAKPAADAEPKKSAKSAAKDAAVPVTFKASGAVAKKDTAVPEPSFDDEDTLDKVHVSKKVKTVDWDDLDAEDGNDPLMLAEYVEEIFEYMRDLEVQTMPNPDYMDLQKELQWKMRSILVDWLIEVHYKFRLLAETLYLAVNIVDRFLSLRVISLVKLQLVGVTAMFIAAKYEEVMAPSIQNFLYMADGGYTDEEILRAERYVLQVLDFALQYPTPMSFLRRCSKADNYDIQTRTLAKYLMEVSLIDHRFLRMPSSMIAAAGLYLARRMLDRGPWSANLKHYSGYGEEELLECANLMLDYLEKPVRYEALYKKYSGRKFMKAAIFVEDWIARRKKERQAKQEAEAIDAIVHSSSSGSSKAAVPEPASRRHESRPAYDEQQDEYEEVAPYNDCDGQSDSS